MTTEPTPPTPNDPPPGTEKVEPGPDALTADSPNVPKVEGDPAGEPSDDPELAAVGVEKVAARPGRQQKLDDLFKGKKFVILKEVRLNEDERFRTPLGHTGRHGWIVQEISNPDNKFIVGFSLLQAMHDTYDAVDLPAARLRGRPKKTVDPVSTHESAEAVAAV